MRSFALKGRVVSVKSRDEALLYGLSQAQVLHSVLDLHVLSQIVDGFRDKLRQSSSALIVCDRPRGIHAVDPGHPLQNPVGLMGLALRP